MAERAVRNTLVAPVGRRTLLAGAGAGLLALAGAVPVVRSVVGDPAPGPELPELPELAFLPAPDGALVGELVATVATGIAGTGTGLAYNGSAPGPLLRLREGQRVALHFRNDLDVHSSLHLHGVPLSPAVDAPLTHLETGEADVREFTLPPGSAGTYWYHPHAHGDVERQMLAGLTGPVVVHGPLDNIPGLAEADDRLVMLTARRGEISVNGVVRPRLTARAATVRLSLLNATVGEHVLVGAVSGGRRTPLHQIATDGGLLDRPVEIEELLLAPGERTEVLLVTTGPGAVELLALPYSTYGPGGDASSEQTLVPITVPDGLVPVPLPERLLPVEALDPASSVRTRRIVLDKAADGGFTVDGRTFDAARTDIEAALGTTETWEVVNEHSTDHPFHLHSYAVQVVDRDGVAEPFVAWRDTVNVPPGSAVQLLVPFRGDGGRTVYHCHIAAHEDLGMMGVLDVVG